MIVGPTAKRRCHPHAPEFARIYASEIAELEGALANQQPDQARLNAAYAAYYDEGRHPLDQHGESQN
jgi:hypothetical protein